MSRRAWQRRNLSRSVVREAARINGRVRTMWSAASGQARVQGYRDPVAGCCPHCTQPIKTRTEGEDCGGYPEGTLWNCAACGAASAYSQSGCWYQPGRPSAA